MGRVVLLIDTGPLVAVQNRADPAHGRSTELLQEAPGPLVVPVLVVAEVSYLVGSRLGSRAEQRFCSSLAAGELLVEHVAPRDWARIAELVDRYDDLPLGTVDASVVAAAERLGVTTIATLDRRDFSVVRPAHADAFELVP